jgi:hypothetical protein
MDHAVLLGHKDPAASVGKQEAMVNRVRKDIKGHLARMDPKDPEEKSETMALLERVRENPESLGLEDQRALQEKWVSPESLVLTAGREAAVSAESLERREHPERQDPLRRRLDQREPVDPLEPQECLESPESQVVPVLAESPEYPEMQENEVPRDPRDQQV